MTNKFGVIILIFITSFFMLLARPVSAAVEFDLIAPSGQFTRGQEIQFIINISTGGGTVSSTQIGMTYDTEFLEYVNAVPGDAMNTISVSDQGDGKLLITGSNTAGYTGTGSYALINLKIIASAPGSTQLCTLFAPESAPTVAPTAQPNAPQPTRLPTSGNISRTITIGVAGAVLLAIAATGVLFNQNQIQKTGHHKNKKTKHV